MTEVTESHELDENDCADIQYQYKSSMPIPYNIAVLPSPPPDFIPCPVQSHMGDNFKAKGHVQFSKLRNKTYWVLFFVSEVGGMYSLK